MDLNASLVMISFVSVIAACVIVGTYLLGVYVMSRIGRKLGIGTFEQYCVPFYNVALMFRWIGLSGWVAVGFCIVWLIGAVLLALSRSAPEFAWAWVMFWVLVGPFHLAFQVYFWGTVAGRLGKSFWLYGLT